MESNTIHEDMLSKKFIDHILKISEMKIDNCDEIQLTLLLSLCKNTAFMEKANQRLQINTVKQVEERLVKEFIPKFKGRSLALICHNTVQKRR